MRRLLRAIARDEEITQDVSTLENPAIIDQLRGVDTAPAARPSKSKASRKRAAAAQTKKKTSSRKKSVSRASKRGVSGKKRPSKRLAAVRKTSKRRTARHK
jgi:hypothetical protein